MSGDLTAEQILALTEPERLYPNDAVAAKDRFKALAMDWHPDRNKHTLASKVMSHIGELYQKALERIEAGTWSEPGVFSFVGDGKVRRIRYSAQHDFELGRMFIGNKLATFLVGNKHEDLVLRGLRAVGSIRYPDKKWKTDMEPFFPKVEKICAAPAHNAQAIIVKKDEDAILLKDLIKHLGGEIDPKHVAWIISSLLNLCAFLSVTGVSHNGLSPDTVFVSPKNHSGFLLGGWWYSAEFGKPLRTVPRYTFDLMTSVERSLKVAGPRLDLECVKAIGRDCIGLKALNSLPKPYIEFLKLPASSKPIDEYEQWVKVLKDSYGARRFIKLDVTPSAVYGG